MAQIREQEESSKNMIKYFEIMKDDPKDTIKMFNDRLTQDAMLQIDYTHLNEEKVKLTIELQDLHQELEKQKVCLEINIEFKLDS